MRNRLRRVLAVAEARGAVSALERVLGEVEVDAVALVGNLVQPWSKPETYRALLKALGEAGTPAFWVPGRDDAPLREYLSESYNMEIVFPSLRGVHGTAALAPGGVVFAGMGGEILDDPDTIRSEEHLVRYPGWEAEYQLKVVGEIDAPERVFLFWTPPAHKGLGTPGSAVLAELIKTYDPIAVVVGGEEPAQTVLGTSLVVAPGRLDRGRYAVIDLAERRAEQGQVEVPEEEEVEVGEGS
ncbi:MAG: heat-stable protein [Thermoleophilia bacterium]